jgi:halocyanin-like protein
MDRRTLLRSLGGAGALALAGCLGGPGNGAATESDRYGDWFRNTDNFDGTVDRTGQDEVSVAVGASGNNGNLAFDPPAVRVSPGTTIVWDWTGDGGLHNVVEQQGAFESELRNSDEYTYERTFEEPGTVLYVCSPHRSQGMRGAVVVAEGGGSTEA